MNNTVPDSIHVQIQRSWDAINIERIINSLRLGGKNCERQICECGRVVLAVKRRSMQQAI